jgi:hypothetical protein
MHALPRADPASPQRRKPASAVVPAAALASQIAVGADGRPAPPRVPNPIVPPRTARGGRCRARRHHELPARRRSSVVAERAPARASEIADEATIQIKPSEGVDMRKHGPAPSTYDAGAWRQHRDGDQRARKERAVELSFDHFDASELPIPHDAVRITADADPPRWRAAREGRSRPPISTITVNG